MGLDNVLHTVHSFDLRVLCQLIVYFFLTKLYSCLCACADLFVHDSLMLLYPLVVNSIYAEKS